MKKRAMINNVAIARKCDTTEQATLKYIDVKIKNFTNAMVLSGDYVESNKAKADYFEIRGALKTLYILDLITADEMAEIADSITDVINTATQTDQEDQEQCAS